MTETSPVWTQTGTASWITQTPSHFATINLVLEGEGVPYLWAIYPMPRPEGIWMPTWRGGCATFAQARAAAEEHMDGEAKS